MTETEIKNLLGVIGICEKAGRLICGTDQICDALRSFGKVPLLVIEASDTSDNTHKRICDRCKYYEVRHERIEASAEDLGKAVGKKRAVAAVGITDAGLCRAVDKKLTNTGSGNAGIDKQ